MEGTVLEKISDRTSSTTGSEAKYLGKFSKPIYAADGYRSPFLMT